MCYNINMEKKSLGYKYKFSKWFYLIAVLGYLVSIGCIVLNAIRFSIKLNKNIEIAFTEYMSLAFAVVLSIAFIVIVTLALIKSEYKIFDDKIILKWGIIKNPIELNEVKLIRFITTTEKLELVFEDESYFVIVIDKKDYQKFVDELKSIKPKLEYNQTSEE